MFEFCVEGIKTIDFLFLKNQEIGNIRLNMEERYERTDTVPEAGLSIISFQYLIQL